VENHKQIEDLAAEFLARRDGGNWTAEDQACFMRWMEASTAHRVAVLRLEVGWKEARRLQVLIAGTSAEAVPPKGAWRQSLYFSQYDRSIPNSESAPTQVASVVWHGRRPKLLGLAAAFLLVVLLYFVLSPRDERYSTPIGAVESVALRDGSGITLNTNSELRVDLNSHERRIGLERGEAYFEVAKDPNRPFVVRTGDKRVVAIGTKFSVSREADSIKVVVAEGSVRLETDGPPLRVERRGGGTNLPSIVQTAVPLSAGTLARAQDETLLVQDSSMLQVQDALSWRQGRLTFHETPLSVAIEQFNRFNTHKIVIGDPSIATIRINGAFRPANYQAFIRLLEEGFFLHASSTETDTTLTK
jgi:transmembrane sensor